MAKTKKMNTTTMILIVVMLIAFAWVLFRSRTKMKVGTSTIGGEEATTGGSLTGLPAGCFPFEEVHETGNHPGQMWLSIIPFLADGETRVRPKADEFDIGGQVEVNGTGSALDGVYTIHNIWYDSVGDIGSFRVDVPGGYNFSYNALQGGNPRDMTYFGIGRICKVS